MPGLSITLTDAGRAALINAQNTGTVALSITQVGVSPTHTAGDLSGAVAIPGELKRLNSFGGDVVADDTLHLTIRDESADTYSLRSFGLYLSDGTLFAAYSQAVTILEKSSSAMLLLATDIVLASLTTAMIEFGDTSFINPPATSSTPGVIEIADQTEVDAGARNDVAVPPSRLKVLLTALLGGKSDTGHAHDAAAVTSGTFSVLRIPDLAMAKITGLVAALAGKSDTGHTHDAGAVTSGTFSVLRIPDLAMAKITGLAAALGGKSDTGHTHDAGAVTSGIFDVLRIPDLAMAKITGLAAALGGKSDTGHTHDAGAVTSGIFDVLRIPDLAMAKITGLAAALGGKSDTGHTHDAGAVTSGIFDVLRIPDLAIAKITGLVAALAGKASTTSATIGGTTMNAVNDGQVMILRGGTSNGAFVSIYKSAASPGVRSGYLGYPSPGTGHFAIVNEMTGGDIQFTTLDPTRNVYANGALIWNTANFDPASKSNTGHTHTVADITNLLDTVWPAGQLHLFDSATVPNSARALIANGAVVSRTTYARLFAVIGTRYGVGDGATTFQLPDWRAVFFRGLDNGRGFDIGRSLGVFQYSQNLDHSHGIPSRSNQNGGNGYVEDASAEDLTRTVNTFNEGGSEARPINQALLACISY